MFNQDLEATKMSSFFDVLQRNGASSINLEKCGDIVLSPNDNMVAFICHFCKDIFTLLPQFLRHMQLKHVDVLPFTQDNFVYSLEELLDISNEEAQPRYDNSSGNKNSVMTIKTNCTDACLDEYKAEGLCAKETFANNQIIFKGNYISGKTAEKCQMNGLQHEAISINQVPPISNRMSVHAVENNNSQYGHYILKLCNGKGAEHFEQQKKETSLHANDIGDEGIDINKNQIITNQSAKQMQAHTINFKVPLAEVPIAKKKLGESETKRLWRLRESNNNQQDKRKLQSTLNPKSYGIQKMKGEIQYCMNTIKKRIMLSLENDQKQQRVPLKELKDKVQIESVEFLPNINICPDKQVPKIFHNQDSSAKVGHQTKPQQIVSKLHFKDENVFDVQNAIKPYSIGVQQLEYNHLFRKPDLKIVSSTPQPLRFKQRPVNAKIANAETNKSKTSYKLEIIRNEKGSTIHCIRKTDNHKITEICNTTNPNEPLEKNQLVNVFKTPTTSSVKINLQKTKIVQQTSLSTVDLNVIKNFPLDLNLLKFVGLITIKIPKYEDTLPIEVFNATRELSNTFAKLLQGFESIWKTKTYSQNHAGQLNAEMEKLTAATNKALGLTISTSQLKRIVNLISIWYVKQVDNKFCKKVILSSVYEYYMKMFAFIPKIRCRCYCEFCEKWFNTPVQYIQHREAHFTNQTFQCIYCEKNFSVRSYLENHAHTHIEQILK